MKNAHQLFLSFLVLIVGFFGNEYIYGQQVKTEVIYYPGTKVKKLEYQQYSTKAGTVGNIEYRDDKTKLLKDYDPNSYSLNQFVRHGYRKEFYPNGTLMKVENYVHGSREGEVKEYYENGVLKNQGTSKKGVFDGSYSEYFENGKLQSKVTYSNGRRVGASTLFNDEGNIEAYLNYDQPDASGASPIRVLYQAKHPNGKVSEEGLLKCSMNYNDFQRTDIFKWFDEQGVKIQEISYVDDVPKTITTFYPSGNKKVEKTYALYKNNDGYYVMVEGPYKEYHENGQLAKSGVMNTLESQSKSNPDEIEREEYRAGDWREYDQTGKFVHFTSYGEKDQILTDMDQKAIDEQGNISESLDLNTYKSRSIDKFGKYLRFNYPIINFDNMGNARVGFFEDVYAKSMSVVSEFNAAMAKCTTKECVTNFSKKLDRVYNKLEWLRKVTLDAVAAKNNEAVNFMQKIDYDGIKSALGVE